ncbi:hypothetical protein [Shinella sp.]|uniref:hypothetical protein n=1 Tax=Shinella sp. TaxID=1870904 RepID=UPI0029ACCE51|nr:hypothetical protein [Shinella sp.]MDX3977002.1 hypothetical protein [Shinella sp.]
MTIKPVKFTVKKPVIIDGHEVGKGVYVGQKISETEIERAMKRSASYFFHLAAPDVDENITVVRRFDLDVTEYVAKGAIIVS